MKRIEIIFSQAIEEDIFLALKDIPQAQFFTLIPGARGKGYSTPKMGDAVWPEVNEVMVIYTADKNAVSEIERAIGELQKKYSSEGLAIFVI
ncbi:MAG TPA: hypothetical protein PLU93_00900 [Treponemataceae bacterium]|nr:hypothetical protein [Treponemataceae bacterium]